MQREYPSLPIPTVGAVVFDGERVLLARRGKAPSQGVWTLPGGAIEIGESVRQAIEREVCEECGIVVQAGQVIEVLDVIQRDQAGQVRFHYVLIDLACQYVSGHIAAGDDVVDVRWAHPDEFEALGVPPRARQVIAKARQAGVTNRAG